MRAAPDTVRSMVQNDGVEACAVTEPVRHLSDGRVDLDGAPVLGQRIGKVPLKRGGTVSANGSARILHAADGWYCKPASVAHRLELRAARPSSGPPASPSSAPGTSHGRKQRAGHVRAGSRTSSIYA